MLRAREREGEMGKMGKMRKMGKIGKLAISHLDLRMESQKPGF